MGSDAATPRAARMRWRTPLLATAVSRAFVFALGMGAYAVVGATGGSLQRHADPSRVTTSLGTVGNVLAAPVYRWDSVYYVEVATHGYDRLKVTNFFPLYPWLLSLVDVVVGSPVIAGVLVSLAALIPALALLERLAAVELGSTAAGERTVWLVALFPTSLYLSAVYTEALFLLVSVGAFWAAREDRWLWAGLLGGCASLTRSVGVLVLVPLVLLYLYGPRGTRAPDRRERAHRRIPSFRLRPDVLFLLLVPAGSAIYMAVSGDRFGDPFVGWTSANELFGRHFTGPYSGIVIGAWDLVGTFGDAATGAIGPAKAAQQLAIFVVAVGFVAAGIAMLWELPVAYGVYVLVGLLPALSTPVSGGGALASIPRYVLVAFPVFLWLGGRLTDRRRYLAVLAVFVAGLAYCTVRFATWHYVS